jgi:hypothetical protein
LPATQKRRHHTRTGLFVRPEILHAEQGVSSYYSNQCQPAEIKAFGHDLGTDKYLYPTFTEALDDLIFHRLVLADVAVQSCNLSCWKECLCFLFNSLCASS